MIFPKKEIKKTYSLVLAPSLRRKIGLEAKKNGVSFSAFIEGVFLSFSKNKIKT